MALELIKWPVTSSMQKSTQSLHVFSDLFSDGLGKYYLDNNFKMLIVPRIFSESHFFGNLPSNRIWILTYAKNMKHHFTCSFLTVSSIWNIINYIFFLIGGCDLLWLISNVNLRFHPFECKLPFFVNIFLDLLLECISACRISRCFYGKSSSQCKKEQENPIQISTEAEQDGLSVERIHIENMKLRF